MVLIFPNLCLWRRSLRSNLGRIHYKKLYRATLRKLSKTALKRKIKQTLSEIQASGDCYIDLPEIIQKVKLNLLSS